MWTTDGLANESDVEQKFAYPLLTEAKPLGLAYPPEIIQTKANVRRLAIGKGREQKLYFPDYLIVSMGLPLLVVEAKHPAEKLAEGFREARLYAHELNALFEHEVTPTKYVIATNGKELWFGYFDQADPLISVSCSSLGAYSPELAQLIELVSWGPLSAHANSISLAQRPEGLFKPRKLVGGALSQNEEVPINSFGATVTTSVSHIFNPQNIDDRINIVQNAYVPSSRRQRYIDPIDRIIRAARPPSETQTNLMEDTSEPNEIVNKLKDRKSLEHKVMLIVGGVGSGKSTFIDYLQEVALKNHYEPPLVWCRINMNNAPVSTEEIYNWLRLEIISGCKSSLPNKDFDDLDVIKKLYGVEISKFTKGVGKLYSNNPEIYDLKLGEHIQAVQEDLHQVTNAYVRFCCGERGKLCMIVLDNSDKKTRDEQLLMFEAAQWIQKEFRSLVVLPLRDETFDNHRDQPPLDTALKDMVFRIEPPLFQQVLMKRVQLALSEMTPGHGSKLKFALPNGFNVEYPRSDQAYYLTSIIKSLFAHDRFARRLIVGLAGRNIRRALELFLEFCSSGYIGDDQIFKIRQSEGNYALPFNQVANVIIRMNRRYYDSDDSYIKNIFSANASDKYPTYFCRVMILKWLKIHFKDVGPAKLPGYFKKIEIKRALISYGLSPDVIDREFNVLLGSKCLIAEHLREDTLSNDDLVKIGPAGFVHLDLIGNLNYLSAVSEDTLFSDRETAEKIANRIKDPNKHLHKTTAIKNSEDLVQYLDEMKKEVLQQNDGFLENSMGDRLADISEAKDALSRILKSKSDDPWFNADKDLKRRSRHFVIVTNDVPFGIFVEFDNGLSGLVHSSNMDGMKATVGDLVEVEIIWVDVIQRKMGLKLIELIEEDAGEKY